MEQKILVVDDDRITQLVLKGALRDQGYEVILASSGEQGLEQAHKHQPALIICDWQMEAIDGLEVCRRIKSEPSLSATFFILLTSRSSVEDRIKGLDTGADEFLTKPIDVSELKARVRAGLRLYQTNQELQRLAQDLKLQQELLETELNEAADYVKSILPAPISGLVSINSKFLPSSKLGGDCFDYYWLDEDYLLIYLLDVSGHGLAAALPSISVHNLLRSHYLPKASLYKPAEVLQNLNDLFQMDQQNANYFTIWYGVFNCSSNQLTYASAGHPPALLLSTANNSGLEVTQLVTPSVPIGTITEVEYYDAVCTIPTDSKLYVFSDGVYEIEQPDGNIWSFNELINLLTSTYEQGINLSLDKLIEEIKTLTKAQFFTDDCSLIEINFNTDLLPAKMILDREKIQITL
ncbi:SpoIIE family protein phosphatase [Aetokthonos hydrillicola Thurmond2011]|jgi:sigma-B regulation protein RsbU (phosphoserine phosphatase)|uniref:SpoIIE family protein phosphatase n=1 Tax=Aetokthonos hydrillicola Thurmond2011 TaxID=2712845 RepID=A0AAP5ICF6_9CYAN|nr:SpoIIE family protein phosphatase [Aetokthonos hydrillicola]MBO3463085.1 SpoIIE family protein phosphatase [Aetokthonos hydrillicola CCALA 1050]MBW4587034.1 SpoIIE family protein phosphatase [Aetokthonos hydrillicola CCALA 1050]MDR9897492.1 SpoIIE family protein phosphatase [Aetokthonos hydrillicola Thurmond2011]